MEQDTTARSLMDRARHGAINKLDAQRERAATGVGSMVGALRESSRQLQGQNETAATVVDNAASQLERFSGALHDRDVHQIVREVEDFARQRPSIFIGSAFALGLAAARFLKSSAPEDDLATGRRSTYRAGSSGTVGAAPTWPQEPVAGGIDPLTSGTVPGTARATEEWRGGPAATPAPRR